MATCGSALAAGLSVLREEKARQLTQQMATAQGHLRLSATLFNSFRTADGLPDNTVTQVLQLPTGQMAVGTNLGIALFHPTAGFTQLAGVKIYNSNTGYPVKDVNGAQNTMLVDRQGVVWAGTGSAKTALVRFDYQALHPYTAPPVVVLQAVTVNEEDIGWYDLLDRGIRKNARDSATARLQDFLAYGATPSPAQADSLRRRFGKVQFDGIAPFYPLPQHLVLPYRHNAVGFAFAAIETARPALVRYQYRLEGYDQDWSPVTSRASASFGNIPEGDYTFRLRAQGANGVWSAPLAYSFTVQPPWYRTWWAYLAYAVLFGAALRVFSHWRERKLRAEKAQLEQLVVDRTAVVEEQKLSLQAQHDALDASLTQLHAAQAELVRQEKLASVGQLTKGIVDRILNPLNYVSNFAQLSDGLVKSVADTLGQQHEVLPADTLEFLLEDLGVLQDNSCKIQEHSASTTRILKDMQKLLKEKSRDLVETDLNSFLENKARTALQEITPEYKSFAVKLVFDPEPRPVRINLLPFEFGQVVQSLVENACYTLFEKSKTVQDFTPELHVSTRLAAGQVVVRLRDNGKGIAAREVPRLFSPFFTTKPTSKGTGLGLYMAKDIIAMHQGTIVIDTREGEFTEIVLTLPAPVR